MKKVAAATINRSTAVKPLDLGFREIKELFEIKEEMPEKSVKVEDATPAPGGMSPSAVKRKVVRQIIKSKADAIRLNNNELTSITGLEEILNDVLETPEELKWIDLSFNHIKALDSATLKSFPKLSRLYLHANDLRSLSDIDKLRPIGKRVRFLTLHGNPVSEKTHYRNYVLSVFPKLRQLDYGAISKMDREKAKAWHDFHRRILEEREEKRRVAELEAQAVEPPKK